MRSVEINGGMELFVAALEVIKQRANRGVECSSDPIRELEGRSGGLRRGERTADGGGDALFW